MNEIRKQREIEKQENLTAMVLQEFTSAMHERGINYWKAPRERDLLVWLQWSRMLGARIGDVIGKLTDHYRRVFRMQGSRGLGFQTATMSGPAAWSWVQEEFRNVRVQRQTLGRLPKTYRSLEDYQEQMHRRRIMAARGTSKGLPYRGSARWVRPAVIAEDPILRAFGYTGRER